MYHDVSTGHVYSAEPSYLISKEPSKILGRTKSPLLTPEKHYELKGDVNNVVFSTGACILDEWVICILWCCR